MAPRLMLKWLAITGVLVFCAYCITLSVVYFQP